MSESNLMRQIMKAVSSAGVTIFRNNIGKAWIGKSKRITIAGNYFLTAGDVVISNARPFHAGLVVGSSDLIGWKPVKITNEMVGNTMAVFVGLEVKEGRGTTTHEQKLFIAAVRRSGGVCGAVYSVDEALGLFNGM